MDRNQAICWRPSAERIASSHLSRFTALAAASSSAPACGADPVESYAALHAWSLREPADFWDVLWRYADVIGERGVQTLEAGDQLPGARWFSDSRLNYAENLLAGPGDEQVLIALDEAGVRRCHTRGQLRRDVRAAAAGLTRLGVRRGDVVAGFVANSPEALIAMLATAWLGAIWTSTSPDFGAAGVIDRFGQTGARVLIATAACHYAGRQHDCAATIGHVADELTSLEHVVLIAAAAPLTTRRAVAHSRWEQLLASDPLAAPEPLRQEFAAPLFILYSSGTTGKPKAIIHGAGGTLLQHLKEHLLHTDIRAGDCVFYYTTCGWMMWNWLVSALASRAVVLLYDGSPAHPATDTLWRIAAEERVTAFGTSPRYLAMLEKEGIRPREHFDLAALRTLLSTGAPLSPNQFAFVHEAIKPDVHLASISGGTDIVSCFCLGVPWLPVRRGELQAAGLGMAADVVNDEGRSVVDEPGELVCRAAFPSMPLGFLGDAGGERYREAYFSRFPGIWHHGDYAIRTSAGGFIILGRSDAVLNPGGVRIGTAEIYRQVELIPEVRESLAIGQKQTGGDERIVLFVRMMPGHTLDAGLERGIRDRIRASTTPRHVPARIVEVADLPRTLSGKLVELAVRNVVNGLPVKNLEALANPESLELFRDLPELQN
jgi:acetoacetyl-CoA synthetase